jgi:spore coat polysaccharide biosynthesis predicted glycosyltransferase SpsG
MPPVLSGWDCFLLGVPPPIRTVWRPDSDVLVLTGGSDPTGLGKTLPVQLNDRLAAKTRIDWVSGPYAVPPSFPSAPRVSFVLHRAPPCLDRLMDLASYALAVYGVSFYELLYYGVPTVVFSPYGDKDKAELAIVEAEGLALTARDAEDAVEQLHRLMQDEVLAMGLSQRARARMAARGEEKFIHAVAKLMGEA